MPRGSCHFHPLSCGGKSPTGLALHSTTGWRSLPKFNLPESISKFTPETSRERGRDRPRKDDKPALDCVLQMQMTTVCSFSHSFSLPTSPALTAPQLSQGEGRVAHWISLSFAVLLRGLKQENLERTHTVPRSGNQTHDLFAVCECANHHTTLCVLICSHMSLQAGH